MQHKPWYTSLTIWANIIIIAVAVLTAPEVLNLFPAWAEPAILAVTAILNIALRFITGEPISQVGARRAARR